MKISEAAASCGLSVDTIRFYEKSGMLPAIARGADGQRRFSAGDVDWLTLLYWLRETGMPLAEMRRFTRLAKEGGATVAARQEILLAHQQELARRRRMLDRCEEVLAVKLASYGAVS